MHLPVIGHVGGIVICMTTVFLGESSKALDSLASISIGAAARRVEGLKPLICIGPQPRDSFNRDYIHIIRRSAGEAALHISTESGSRTAGGRDLRSRQQKIKGHFGPNYFWRQKIWPGQIESCLQQDKHAHNI